MIRVNKDSQYDVFAGRPSKFSNPFVKGKDGNRDVVIKKFEEYIRIHPKLNEFLDELDGKRVACWCTLNEKCHVDVFAKLIHERKQSLNLENIIEK